MKNKSDLLEDQQIHYIVKDYRRMFDMHYKLVDACKEASKALDKRDKKIALLENKLNKSVSAKFRMNVLNQVKLIDDQLLSCKIHAEKGQNLIVSLVKMLEKQEDETTEEDKPTLFKRVINYLKINYAKLVKYILHNRGSKGNPSED